MLTDRLEHLLPKSHPELSHATRVQSTCFSAMPYIISWRKEVFSESVVSENEK